jgi:hypothetical protein
VHNPVAVLEQVAAKKFTRPRGDGVVRACRAEIHKQFRCVRISRNEFDNLIDLKEAPMECPHLAGVYMKYCVAEKELYVPSIYEMREYCKYLQHRICRHYMQADNGPTTIDHAPVCRDSACN